MQIEGHIATEQSYTSVSRISLVPVHLVSEASVNHQGVVLTHRVGRHPTLCCTVPLDKAGANAYRKASPNRVLRASTS